MCDGPSTPDATPGVDDESFETTDTQAWGIEHDYMQAMAPTNPLTVEDYYQGWFARNGAGFQLAGMNQVFVTNALMPFYPDALEPDDTPQAARPIVPVPYATSGTGKVVLDEIEMGAADAFELFNGSDAAVQLAGWQVEVFANGTTQDPTRIYTFPPFTLQPG